MCPVSRFVVAATHSKTTLLVSWLGPVTVAGSLGTPVLTIGARPGIALGWVASLGGGTLRARAGQGDLALLLSWQGPVTMHGCSTQLLTVNVQPRPAACCSVLSYGRAAALCSCQC